MRGGRATRGSASGEVVAASVGGALCGVIKGTITKLIGTQARVGYQVKFPRDGKAIFHWLDIEVRPEMAILPVNA